MWIDLRRCLLYVGCVSGIKVRASALRAGGFGTSGGGTFTLFFRVVCDAI